MDSRLLPLPTTMSALAPVHQVAKMSAFSVLEEARKAPSAPTSGFGYFARCALAGAICCGVTHSLVVPVDVVKTRMQTSPGRYNGMLDGFRRIPKEEGAMMLLQGLGPTAVGYFMQGAFKFGFYELFKKSFMGLFEPETADKYRMLIWSVASGSAETIADLALCPMEATRIRLVAEPSFASGFLPAFSRIAKEEGVNGFYKGLGPILLKQVPYTIAKFVCFEFASRFVYDRVDKDSLSSGGQVVVSLGGGIFAGVIAAIVSQPADTVLSKINQEKTDDGVLKAIGNIMRRLGVNGLFLGLGARCVMVGTLTALQFAIYDSIKIAFGLPTTGGKK